MSKLIRSIKQEHSQTWLARHRPLIFAVVVLGVIVSSSLLMHYIRGYRPDPEKGLKSSGLLVATSEPKGAKVYVDGKLVTATHDTVYLEPGEYWVEIKKDGYIPWKKKLTIFKELVTQTNALLFSVAPDLKSITYRGVIKPLLSPDQSKIVYAVDIPQLKSQTEQEASDSALPPYLNLEDTGLWMIELNDLPLGFSQSPRQIVRGIPLNRRWQEADFIWSPNSRQLMVVFWSQPDQDKRQSALREIKDSPPPELVYLLDITKTYDLIDLPNRRIEYNLIVQDWQTQSQLKLEQKLKLLPDELSTLLATSSADLRFSPDETKLMYTATTSAQLADQYRDPVPSASTQPQTRQLESNQLYIYDLKEDRNFVIDQQITTEQAQLKGNLWTEPLVGLSHTLYQPQYRWFPSSRHLIHIQADKISLLEYDNTNRTVVFSGESSQAFPAASTDKLIISTTLNPSSFPLPNLYHLILQ